jgi:hypothetical protein
VDLGTEHVHGALRQTIPLARTMAEQMRALREWTDGRARHASE